MRRITSLDVWKSPYIRTKKLNLTRLVGPFLERYYNNHLALQCQTWTIPIFLLRRFICSSINSVIRSTLICLLNLWKPSKFMNFISKHKKNRLIILSITSLYMYIVTFWIKWNYKMGKNTTQDQSNHIPKSRKWSSRRDKLYIFINSF